MKIEATTVTEVVVYDSQFTGTAVVVEFAVGPAAFQRHRYALTPADAEHLAEQLRFAATVA